MKRPISEAPKDGTVILAEIMRHAGVPETGGYEFTRLKFSEPWWRDAENENLAYGESTILCWYADGTDPKLLTLTERTNWNYQPSNGTGGDIFYGEWCERCIRERAVRDDYDKAMANDLGCEIFARSMAFNIGDPQYPSEWTYKPDGVPKCTAFELDVGEPKQEARCPHTLDMFR
jgi:hypothetical protein